MTADAYATLGVSRNATPDEIRAAYRMRSRELHPDRNPSPNANRVMAAVNVAYETLSDPSRRQSHDQTLRERMRSGGPMPREAPPAPPRPKAPPKAGVKRPRPPSSGRGSLQPDRLPDWYAFLGLDRRVSAAEVLLAAGDVGREIRQAGYAIDDLDRLLLQLRQAVATLTTRRDRDFYDGAIAGYPPPPGEYVHLHKDYFSFLGVRRTASPERIAEAATALSGKVPRKSKEYAELERAWRTLRDPELRATYEASLV